MRLFIFFQGMRCIPHSRHCVLREVQGEYLFFLLVIGDRPTGLAVNIDGRAQGQKGVDPRKLVFAGVLQRSLLPPPFGFVVPLFTSNCLARRTECFAWRS